jgi:hypothetical protein
LNDKASQRFQAIKDHFHFGAETSVIEMLIGKEFQRIERTKVHRVFLPNEVYDKAEKAAAALNLTIDEYIDSVTEQLLKNPNEGLKHGKS